MERLETFVSRLQGSLPPTEEGLPLKSGPGSALGNMSDDSDEQDVSSQIGKLRLYQSGSTQWVEPFHWESIIDDARSLLPTKRALY